MKIIGTALLVLAVTASFAFADGMSANSTGATGSQDTQAQSQDANGIVVHKNKKHDKTGTNSGASQGAQDGQTEGSSH